MSKLDVQRPPRIAFVTQWFPPEPGAPEIYFNLARGLSDLGCSVRVITAVPNYPLGRTFPGYSPWRAMVEDIRGLTALRVPVVPSHGDSAVGRVSNYASFAASAAIWGRQWLSTSDVNILVSSPATVDAVGAAYRKLCGSEYVLLLQDIWPETVFATGFIEEGQARRVAEIALTGYVNGTVRGASRVLVNSPSLVDALVARGAAPGRLGVLHNWVDEAVFEPGADAGHLRLILGLAPTDRVFLYSGNLGFAQGLDQWIEAFRVGLVPAGAHLVIQGDGAARKELRRLAQGAPNVHFLSQKDTAAQAVEVMRGADWLVVSLNDTDLSAVTMPSKVPSSLAMGMPVVATVTGDAARALDESGAGIVAAPAGPSAVASLVVSALAESPERRAERGVAGRRYYERTMSRAHGLDVLRATVDACTEGALTALGAEPPSLTASG